MGDSQREIEPAQLSYAALLGWLVRVGLVLMIGLFALYAFNALPASLPIREVPEYWHLDSSSYTSITGTETGWRWIRNISDAGLLAFAGLVYFPISAIVAVLAAAAFYARNRVAAYAFIALLEGAVLILAATGVFAAA